MYKLYFSHVPLLSFNLTNPCNSFRRQVSFTDGKTEEQNRTFLKTFSIYVSNFRNLEAKFSKESSSHLMHCTCRFLKELSIMESELF